MISVLVVDDEPYVRNMIHSLVDWSAHSMQIKAEAYNGKVALKLIKQQDNRISLVITDLKMPVMDGLELIKQALVIRPDLQFIVISAYDDFHLVKEAFKLGARDYLLKSEMTSEQLNNVLSNIKKRIESGTVMEKPSTHPLQAKLPENGRESGMLRENLLSRFINGNNNVEDLKTLQKLMNVQHGTRMALMMLRLIRSDNTSKDIVDSFKPVLLQLLEQSSNVLTGRDEMHFEIVQITPFEYCLLALYSRSESGSAIMKQLRSLNDSLHPDGFYVNTGLSHIVTDLTLLPRIIYEARVSLDYCFIEGNGSMIRYDNFFDQSMPLCVDAARQTKSLKEYLGSLCLKKGAAGINDILLNPDRIHACNITAVKELYMKYHYILADYVLQNKLNGDTRALLDAYETDLKYFADLNGLNRRMEAVIGSIACSLCGSSVVNQIKNYMEIHYSENISLHSVAKEFQLNSSYLSRIFSERVHMSFVDYLCRIRINRAIELIKTSNLKIYEICEKTGYITTEHFSRTFKKITGKSPKQFMQDGP